jgi:hypothetical protein
LCSLVEGRGHDSDTPVEGVVHSKKIVVLFGLEDFRISRYGLKIITYSKTVATHGQFS